MILQVSAGSPVARWVADDWQGGSGGWVDRIGGATAIPYGGPAKSSGAFADSTSTTSGIVFDGNQAYFELPGGQNPVKGASQLTVLAVFKTTQAPRAVGGASASDPNFWQMAGPINAEAPGSPNDFGLSLDSLGRAKAFFNNAITPSPSVSVIDGKTHTMILTWGANNTGQSGTAKLYVDGVFIGQLQSDAGSGVHQGVSRAIRFGRDIENQRSFVGTLAEVSLYTTVEDPAVLTANLIDSGPTLAAISTSGVEDTAVNFQVSTFGSAYTHSKGTALSSITVETLPSSGVLKLGDTAVSAGQVIPAQNLANLSYVPAANENGIKTFTVSASDGARSSAPATVTMTLSAVNDAPTFSWVTAVGGTKTSAGGYVIHTFTENGSFTPNFSGTVEVLVVGGGGSGGGSTAGGGGGGG